MTSGYDVSLELEKIEEQRLQLSESCFHNCRTWNDNPIAKKPQWNHQNPLMENCTVSCLMWLQTRKDHPNMIKETRIKSQSTKVNHCENAKLKTQKHI